MLNTTFFLLFLIVGTNELAFRGPGLKRWTSSAFSVSLDMSVQTYVQTYVSISPTGGQTKGWGCNCNYTKLTLSYTDPNKAIPPNSPVFCQALKKMGFVCLSVWRKSTGLAGWRNTHFVTLGKSLPPLSPRLVMWGLGGFWQDSMRDYFCKCFLRYEFYNHLSLFLNRPMVLTSFVNHLPWTRAEGQGITSNCSMVLLNSGNLYFADN